MEPPKEFDAVEMMREIREQLSEKYWKHPDILKQEMEETRKRNNFHSSKSQNSKEDTQSP